VSDDTGIDDDGVGTSSTTSSTTSSPTTDDDDFDDDAGHPARRRGRRGRRDEDGRLDGESVTTPPARSWAGEARGAPGGGRPRPGREPNAAAPRHGPLQRLYRGETRFDFVGRRRVWFSLSTVIIVAGIISIILRGGLNLGIEFKGGTEWTVKAPT
jgi:hypothetical protein